MRKILTFNISLKYTQNGRTLDDSDSEEELFANKPHIRSPQISVKYPTKYDSFIMW